MENLKIQNIDKIITNGKTKIKKTINRPLAKIENKTIDNFTTERGIRIRKMINFPLRNIIKVCTKGKVIVDSYPKLEKDKAYIFASTHSFPDEVAALLGTIDRSAYTLIGTTDQLEHNIIIYANWLTGLIYVDRQEKDSRNSSIPKMERIINSGSSILLFPEGGLNNSENLLVNDIFSGAYLLSKKTNTQVVPVSAYKDYGSREIHLSYGEPIDLYNYEKEDGCRVLKDEMATLTYNSIEKNSVPIKRDSLTGNIHEGYMEQRRRVYLETSWAEDVFEEELTVHENKNHIKPEIVWGFMKDVIDEKYEECYSPELQRVIEKDKYDFKEYLHNNWDKKKVKINPLFLRKK